MIYNISMKMQHLLEDEQATSILNQLLPGMIGRVKNQPQAMSLSIEQFVRYSRMPKAEELIHKIDEELQKLNTQENRITPAEKKMMDYFKTLKSEERLEKHYQEAIYPGQPWLDTNGRRIQAHGGAVYYEDGTYYWYGENKEFTDGKNGIWTWGIKIYSSTDLCNWEDRGFLIPPVLDDPNSVLFPTKRVDRPHIIKSSSTGKYVCWLKLSGPEAAFTIWQADSLLGEYTMVEELYNPNGYKIGDFDLMVDEASGKAYIYFDANHEAMVCMSLTEDFCHVDKEMARSYPAQTPPFTREAPALFEMENKKYMITSGMTGYVPNKSDSAMALSWDAEFYSIGNPHVKDSSSASFNSQISKIFKLEGKKDVFIAMADRWLPELKVDEQLVDIFTRVIASNYAPEQFQATLEEKKKMYAANKLETAETRIADYVWLPIQWDGERPQIQWRENWSPKDL